MTTEEIAELGYEYESVGMLFTSTHHASRADMVRSAKKAGEIGANSLILGEIDEPSFGEWLFDRVVFDLDYSAERRSQMMAIRWWLAGEHPGSGLSYQDSLMTMAADAGDVSTFPNSDNRYSYINRAVSALDLRPHSVRWKGARASCHVRRSTAVSRHDQDRQ